MNNTSEFLILNPSDSLIFTEQPGVQSSITLTAFNSSNINVYFKVKTTHPIYYTVKPSLGIVEAYESQIIQVVLRERSPDYEKHNFRVLSAVQNTNVDAVTFWKTVKPSNYSSKKLSVKIITNEEGVYSSSEHVSKQQTLSKQELELYIHQAIQNGQSLLATQKQVFSNLNTISNTVKQYITKEYTEYLIELLKHIYKVIILTKLQHGDVSFIQKFRENYDILTIQSPLWKCFLTEHQLKLLSNFCDMCINSDKIGQSIVNSAKKYFDMCLTLYIDEEAETAIRQLLVEWFKSGKMNKAVFNTWKDFKNKEISPRMIQNIDWQQISDDDYFAEQLEQILQRMTAEKFLYQDDLYNILNIFVFEKPVFKMFTDSCNTNILVVSGRIVFLSDVKGEIERQFEDEKQITEVRFYTKNIFNIDTNLQNKQWHGKNIVIVADKVHVWKSHCIDISGLGHDQRGSKKKACNGETYGENGEDGRDGDAGESSGNIIFLTEELLQGELLTLKLNGGNGQHGEDGGNGANGKNGRGVTKDDLDSLILNYTTLYWGSSSHFFEFTPINTQELSRNVDTYNKYVDAKFKDADGRKMYWSYAEDYSCWTISTYDLYFLIKGTEGTTGGVGGRNGVGGEGGNRGELTARKLFSGKDLFIGKIEQNVGRSGEHGVLGKPGRFGKNGNDMAFVDRSTISSGKKYIGPTENMSIDFQFRMTEDDSRTNGYAKWKKKRSSYYVHFALKEIADGKMTKMETQQRSDANRQTHSKTVSKASIIVSDVVNEFATCFQQDDAILAEVCRAQERADAEEHNENEEQEQETVAEEVSVLLDCVDEDNNVFGRYGIEKKHSDWTKFSKSWKKYDKDVLDLVFELFEHEATEDQLNEDNTKIDQIVDDFKKVFEKGIYQNSKYNTVEIQTLYNTIDNKLKEKKVQAALRAQKSRTFDKYVRVVCTVDRNLNETSTTLIGIEPEKEYIHENKEAVISTFFQKNKMLCVSDALLDAMYAAFIYLKEQHDVDLAIFDPGLIFNWNDETGVKSHLNKIETNANTTPLLRTNQKKKTVETSPLDKLQEILEKDIKNLETVFKNFNEIVKADETKVLVKRFGLLLTKDIAAETTTNEEKEGQEMDSNKTTTSRLEQLKSRAAFIKDYVKSYIEDKHGKARFVVKFYFQTRSILTYNRLLYVCNIYSNAKILHPETEQIMSHSLLNVDDPDFTAFMNERKRNPLDVQSGQCESFMIDHGIDAAAYRFLLAYELNTNVRIFKSTRYATVELQENFNPNGSQKLMLLSENKKMYSLRPDIQYRAMVLARKELINTINMTLQESFNLSEILSIANFFPKEYISIVTLWLRIFRTVNRPHASIFLSLLCHRFQLDGCQLSVIELQAILNAYSHASVICHTDDDFLTKLAAMMPQHHILDAFLYVRIENILKRRIFRNDGNNILNAIHSIDSPHLKALLATKLNEAQFEEKILLKLLTMLRYAVDRFQRLEKMTFQEWIDTSQRQKWSVIGDLLKEFGAVGYYLAFLDSRNRPEEPMLRNCLQEISNTRVLIPEKVIARIAYLIAYGEVNADQTYLNRLKKLFRIISENYSSYLPLEDQNDAGVQLNGYPLLMNERNQNDLLAQVKKHHNETYEPIFPTSQRTVDTLKNLIVGQHDDEQRKIQRQHEIVQLAVQLTSEQCQNALIINEIDAAIAKVFSTSNGPKIHLRDTQKMAILIAAESKKNTLLQVNTGEGKTLLIATLAILRVKQNKVVDVITSSPVLAARDVEKMQPLFKVFRITASHNCEEQLDARKLAYKSQIVYGNMQHFQRDFLLHNFYKKNILGDRKKQCVIVDEVDNMLLDNGNNTLYLSHSVAGMETLMSLFVFLHRAINVPLHGKQQDAQFNTATIRKQILEDMFGYVDKQSLEKLHLDMKVDVNRAWQKLIETNIIDREGLLQIQSEKELPNNFLQLLEAVVNKTFAVKVKDYICSIFYREKYIQVPRYLHFFVLRHLDEFIENTKRAMFMRHNNEYVVDVGHKNVTSDLNPHITIIDKNTGVDLITSQWSEGLHQAVQLKHGCRLSSISLKAIFVSNVGYFKGYEQINGLSGTLGSVEESKTLVALYDADLVRIPTWKPKNFYEHVPLVAANEAVWLQNIYEEVKDQVTAHRSVLIVCNSIDQVNVVQRGLKKLHLLEKNALPGKSRFAQLVRKHLMKGASLKRVFINKIMTDCFENLIVYRRDHDQFDLSGVYALRKSRLIIATNLAGRGTDIELNDSLQQAGGLHVIVAFLPENCRIEEQAFGRAARCGHPGSGQIIALIEDDKRIDASETPTIFQLKEFRDNAEVHRLQSLKQRYDYHTAVEESCLNKFWEHSSRMLEAVQSTKGSTDAHTLPMPMEVIYFALLDEWALWLDEKAPLIQQCARNCSDVDKQAIIESVEHFLSSHPLVNVETATKWIKFPQPLLTLGLIELNNCNISKAEPIFHRVLKDFPEYAAEAYYYIGVIQQRRTRQVYGKLSLSTAFEPDTWKQWLVGTEKREIVVAMDAFHESRRHFSLRKLHRDELATIVARLQCANESIISTNGFADQHREYVAVYDAIIGNIDKFLGKPIEPADLRHDNRDNLGAVFMRNMMQEMGITTRTVLSSEIHEDQIEFICFRHPISRKELVTKLGVIRASDHMSFESEGRPELETFELRRLFTLPSRLDFWNELRDLDVFVEESKFFTTSLEKTIPGLTPANLGAFDGNQTIPLQFTDVPLDSVKLFKLEDVLKAKDENSNIPELKTLLESGFMATEFIAIVDTEKFLNRNVYMRHFEGFTLEEMKDHLNIDDVTAQWILSAYIKDKIIALDADQVYRLIGKQYTNNSLPDALNSAVEKFFADRFAYTHAFDALCNSFMKASKDSSISKFIYLPTNPYEDLLDDMLKCGVVMPSRISLAIPRKIDNGYKDALQSIEHVYDFDKIKEIIEINRPTIADADCKLVATHKYIIDNGTDPNHELKNFISNGFKQVAIVEDDTTWLWLMTISAVLLIVVAVVSVALLSWTGIAIAIVAAAIALAVYAIYQVGTYAYYRMTRVVAKRTVTSDKIADFEFSVLREFNAVSIDEELSKKQQNKLLETVFDGINNLVDTLNNLLTDNLESVIRLDECSSTELSEIIHIPLKTIQQKNQTSYEEFIKFSSIAVEQSIKSQDVIEEMRLIAQSCILKIESELYATLKIELDKKPSYRSLQSLTAVMDRLKEQIVHLNFEVLQKIVKKTCSTLEVNLLKDRKKFNLNLDKDELSISSSDSDNVSNADPISETESYSSEYFDKTFENTLLEFLSESIKNRYTELITRETSHTFREPLLRHFTAFIANYVNLRKESSISLKALELDIYAKRQHQKFEKIVQAKTQVQFLEDEVQQICAEYWNMQHDTTVLHHMIIKGYPLPISAAASMETAIQKLLSQTMPNFHGFNLLLLSKEEKIIYGERKENDAYSLHLTLTLGEEHFYIARNTSSKEVIGSSCFIYEGLCEVTEQFGLIFHTVNEFETELINYL